MKLNFFNKTTDRNSVKRGFTLAELMIVLAVLAVIAAVLMPTVFNSMPDENRLKFKKGYYTLKRTIDAMVNSEAYMETAGLFGKKEALDPNEDPPYAGKLSAGDDGSTYFCVQFSEMLNSTEAQCSNFLPALQTGVVATNFEATTFEGGDNNVLDKKCEGFMPEGCKDAACGVNIKTQDGVYWALPKETFSGTSSSNQRKNVSNYNTIPAYYAVVCMDVDGPGGQAPFGFGIRRDGKVVAGQNAKTWLQEGTTNTLPDAE